MGRLRRGADREGVLALVAEGHLFLAPATLTLLFVAALGRLALARVPAGVPRLADVERLAGALRLADAPAAVTRLTNLVRARRGQRILDGGTTVLSSASTTVGSLATAGSATSVG